MKQGTGAVLRVDSDVEGQAPSSRFPGFHKLTLDQRLTELERRFGLSKEDLELLRSAETLPLATANTMIENAVGTFSLPLGLGLNLQVNGRDYLVPM
ncbi:MAG TPA: hypothetical protein VFE93_12690, partial [Myxococcaceae bacterium]|nr:hypothetical protein [Myxococcaceae bacterium]